ACAVARRDGSGPARLVAYVTGESADPARLRASLAERLPGHLVPAAVMVLDAFPTTVNGKLDRAALPEPEFASRSARPPATRAERVLCEVIAEMLEIADVGPDDNFFELGGDSIVSIQLVARARRAGLAISTRDVFLAKTVAALALAAKAAEEPAAPSPYDGTGPLVPTPVQSWWLEQGGPLQ